MVMKHFRLIRARCCIVVLVVLALCLTGCNGGGGSKFYKVSGKVVDGNGDGIDGVKILVTGGVRVLQQ